MSNSLQILRVWCHWERLLYLICIDKFIKFTQYTTRVCFVWGSLFYLSPVHEILCHWFIVISVFLFILLYILYMCFNWYVCVFCIICSCSLFVMGSFKKNIFCTWFILLLNHRLRWRMFFVWILHVVIARIKNNYS